MIAKIKKFYTKHKLIIDIIVVVSIPLSFILTFLTWRYPIKDIKDLKISLIALSSIIDTQNINNIDTNNLSIFYQDKKIDNLSYLKLRFKNTGTIPITRDDFIEDIKLSLPKEADIISFNVMPKSLLNITNNTPSLLGINSNLLNPEDVVDLEMIINDRGHNLALDNINIAGRIIGIKDIQIKKYEEQKIMSDAEQKKTATQNLKAIFLIVPISIILIALIIWFSLKLDEIEEKPKKTIIEKIFYYGFLGTIALLLTISALYMIGKFLYTLLSNIIILIK